MRKLVIIFFTGCSFSSAFANESGLGLVKATMARYQKANAVEMKVQKKVTLALLDEVQASEGQFVFSKGRMKLDIQKPEPSLLVMNAEAIWVVTPTSNELGGRTQVLKIRSKDLSKQAKAPIAVLLGQAKSWDHFKVKSEKEKNGIVKLELVPLKANEMGEIVSMSLALNKNDRILVSIGYKDELDNETSFKFENTNFSAKITDKTFQYAPPKGADVTEY